MNIELLVVFIILNAVNVILSTIRSLCTINGGKFIAASMNALCYGVYTVVIIYTMCDLPLAYKALIVAAINFIGVWIVKWVEEKARKDKLWKVEATIPTREFHEVTGYLKEQSIPYSYIDIEKYYIFNIYCATQKQSATVKQLLNNSQAKYFVSESKNL